jgi:hypothetical protein
LKKLNGFIEGLVDIGVSMLVMVAKIIKKLGIMHMVSRIESYKIASSTIIRALGKNTNLPIKVGNIQCNMVFFIVNIYSYDILLGLYFFMKFETVVDVEKRVIEV